MRFDSQKRSTQFALLAIAYSGLNAALSFGFTEREFLDESSYWLIIGFVTFVEAFLSFFALLSLIERRRLQYEAQSANYLRQERTVFAIVNSTTPPPTLDFELHQVSEALSMNVAKLNDISQRAQAFEVEVRGLVDKADAAKATAALHEDDARKIAILLGNESQARLKEEIEKLSQAHADQIKQLQKSSTRTAWVTFLGGAIVGFGVNLLTTWMTS